MTMSTRGDASPALSRVEAERLVLELQARADQIRHRRRRVRLAASAGITTLFLSTALVLVRSLIGAPSALAFSSCRPIEASGQTTSLLGLLEHSPGIALIERAGSAGIRPQGVTVRCALRGAKLIAVRVTSSIEPSGDEVNVETWFQPPEFRSVASGTALDIGGRQVSASVLEGGRGLAVTPPGYPGISLVVVSGPSAGRIASLDLKLGVATRTAPDLASLYEVALAGPSTTTVHSTDTPTTWSFEVSSQDELVTKLGSLGLASVAVLPDSPPQEVHVFQGTAGYVITTTYSAAGANGVRIVQSENAPVEPLGGVVIQIRGISGYQVGGVLYWTENGYEAAVDAGDDDPFQFANSLEWVTP